MIAIRKSAFALLLAWLFAQAGCAQAPRAGVASAPCTDEHAVHAVADTPRGRAASYVHITLRPKPTPVPQLNVEMSAQGPNLGTTLRLAAGAPEALEHLTVADEKGALEAKIQSVPPGLVVTIGRTPSPPLRISYTVRATNDVRASASTLVVADDRLRGFGEQVVLLPLGLEDEKSELAVTIDGAALNVPDAASSFGVGKARVREARGRALVRTVFAAGSMGSAVFSAGIEHDEAAWLGYTAFDPRPVSAEIAQVRTALREATFDSSTRAIVGLDPKGPAAAAKLLAGDVIEDADYRDGHAEVAAKFSITRGGSKKEITYMPRGLRRKGPLFSRASPARPTKDVEAYFRFGQHSEQLPTAEHPPRCARECPSSIRRR